MTPVTVSTKYQVVIPLDVRRQVGLKPGERFTMVVKGGVIILVPYREMSELRGIARGADPRRLREKKDRL